MPVSEKTFRQLALEDPSGHWELHCGSLRQKPAMSADHNYLAMYLALQLGQQFDRHEFQVRVNMGHVHHTSGSYYIPDVLVIPADMVRPLRGQHVLEAYDRPLPLVVEVWSPSTGDYDVETKLLEYQRRGDQEIWRLHPYDHTLTAWRPAGARRPDTSGRRQPDGSYLETLFVGGAVRPIALPGVTIDLDALFE